MGHADSVAANSQQRPNLGGRPVDPLILAIEGHVEAIIALDADAAALDHLFHALGRIRMCTTRLESVAHDRIVRIRETVLPEVQRAYEAAEGLRAA